jgi:two-component system sensor histidine kinase KdpD
MAEDRNQTDKRPTPEALLKAAHKEESPHGRLKIFVGAAPGVGKTYEMLQTARARRHDGYDIVVGVVETHGRKETEALLDGLDVIARKPTDYKGQHLTEMDLEAILARKPQIVLVDELAHTNAPGSRHPKRYLDVLELLENGINVYSTINIQHIESLNDVVAQITRVRVRETVPDSVFDRADDVKLVDLTPDDLIQRLKEGKVYVPRQAERALEHFFSPANLTALRELALRRTAERVDEQLLNEMQARAIDGPWAAGERILVCISEDPRAPSLVRYAKRLADRLHGPWVALYVETPRSLQLSETQRDHIAETLRLAQSLGGEPVTLAGGLRRIAEEVVAYAHEHNTTQIIIGKSTRPRWFELLNGSVVHELVRRAGNISVHVIAGDEDGDQIEPWRIDAAEAGRPFNARAYAAALAANVAVVGVGELLDPAIRVESIDLVFLTAIVGVAVRFGLWPSIFASVVASLCYNFFFMPPIYTFTIGDPGNVTAFAFFIVIAIIVSNVAGRARTQAVRAIERARTTESLYAFSRKLAGAGAMEDVLWAAAYQIALLLKVRVVLLLPGDGAIHVRAGYPPEDELDSADLAAARWSWEHDRPAGRGADTLPGGKRLFLPMRTGRGAIGIVGIDSDRPGPLLTPEEHRLLDALSDQAALAIERVRLVDNMDHIQRTVENEKLRSAVLTSLSHDLRTPLAAVIGMAQTLRDLSPKLDETERGELISTIIEESERLNRFIANLLDMTKLQSGAVVAKMGLHDVSEAVGAALRRTAKILAGRRVDVDLASNLPMVEIDPVLFEQILFNLLDNASKYAPPDSTIRLVGRSDGETLSLQIIDEGEGVPAGELESIFDKFYRAQKEDRVRAGTGLGLAISRGFVEAMGGAIVAANRADRSGAIFTISLPVLARNPLLESAS